jgi:hypothetical protein
LPGNDYEVKATLNLASGAAGSYVIYLRATSGSLLASGNTGTYYAVQLTNPVFSGSSCTAGLYVWRSLAGSMTLLSATTSSCFATTVLRAVIRGTTIAVYSNNDITQLIGDSSITNRQPGFGGSAMSGGTVPGVAFGGWFTRVLQPGSPTQL